MGQSEHVRRLDVGQRIARHVDRRTSCHEFKHRAEGLDIAPRRSEVARVNMLIGQYTEEEDNVPKDQTKY